MKTLFVVPTAIVLSLSVLSALPAVAQFEGSPAQNRMERGMNKLNLTEQQKAAMKQLRESTKAQIEAVLTTEQKAQMRSLRQSPGKMRGELKSLNLSEDQKQRIRQIKETTQQQMQSILTEDQKAMLQQQRQGRQDRRQQRQQQVPVQPQ